VAVLWVTEAIQVSYGRECEARLSVSAVGLRCMQGRCMQLDCKTLRSQDTASLKGPTLQGLLTNKDLHRHGALR
jgi:hypothetical protein